VDEAQVGHPRHTRNDKENSMTDQPKKLDLNSLNISAEKQQELLDLFPEARTEDGKIDFDRLKIALGEIVDVGKERYGMNWPGKADCFRTIQTPSSGTLLPCPEESVNFDTTENLIIEGDNLEVLKLLQKSYLGKVKMIYIDPPYNTGNDFIYPDNYSESLQTYLEYTGQVDDAGKKFGTNNDTDGRFHSRWMNMMYPRLYLAKNLLREDGVIFINIGEEELTNLIKISDEIFGEENRLSVISRVAKTASNKGTFFAPTVDFILCYAKNRYELPQFSDSVDESLYRKTEIEGIRKNEKYRDDIALYQSALDTRVNQRYWIQCPDGSFVIPPGKSIPEKIEDGYKAKPEKGDGVWRWTPETFFANRLLLVFKKTNTSPLLDQNGNQANYNIYTKSYLKDRMEGGGTLPRNLLTEFFNRKGADLLKKYKIEFDYSKPVELIKYLLQITGCSGNDIVLDFFAGSCTTGHSVFDWNLQNGSNVKFICVQLPEPIANPDFKTIADIGKERMRRVIYKWKEANQGSLGFDSNKIIGFRVFKLSPSNFKPWNTDLPRDAATLEKQLELHIEHIREGRNQDDILYEILLKSGFPLTTPVESLTLAGKKVFSVAGGELLICLEPDLTMEVIRAMAALKPERVVCLDAGFAGNDQLKTNAVEIFKTQGVPSFKTV
jgi:adenine-specific DNA-methyltransferase